MEQSRQHVPQLQATAAEDEDLNAMLDLNQHSSNVEAQLPMSFDNQSSTQPKPSQSFSISTRPAQDAALLNFSDTGASSAEAEPNPFHMRMMQRQKERELKQSQKPKETKTKEELAQLRKDMMRAKTVKNPAADESQEDPAIKKKEPIHQKSALMSRLATGSKTEISKKDMLKLTNKNYENLPEVRKRKEEE